MSRFLILALVLFLTAGSWPAPGPGHATYGGGGGGGGPTLVQSCQNTDNDVSNTIACVFGSNVTAGSLVVCSLATESAATGATVAFSGGGLTWTIRGQSTTPGTIGKCGIGTAPVSSTAALTVTGSQASGTYDSIQCYEFSGAQVGSGTPTVDADADSPQHEVFTTAAANSYIVAVLSDFTAANGSNGLLSNVPSTMMLAHTAGSPTRYTGYHYRSTDAVAAASANDIGFAAGQHASTGVGHCMFEVAPS